MKRLKNTTAAALFHNESGTSLAVGYNTIEPNDVARMQDTQMSDWFTGGQILFNDGGATDYGGATGFALFGGVSATQVAVAPPAGLDPAAVNAQLAIEALRKCDPRFGVPTFDDFDNRMSWSPTTVGTGASASVGAGNAVYASGKHNGVARVATGTVISTGATLQWSSPQNQSLYVGNGETDCSALVLIPLLGSAPNHYIIRVGVGTTANADHVNGIYFEYDSVTSPNWRLKTASSSTRTVVTSSIAVVANAWIELAWKCNADRTSVSFYVNGVLAGTITTNIPGGVANQGMGPNFQITNPANTLGSLREMVMDWFFWDKRYNVARD